MSHQQKHVLLVDDCEDVLFIHGRFLEQLGYCVTAVGNGRQALDTFLDNRGVYSIIISDYQMPEMDGVELIRTVREFDSQIPVLMISGYMKSFLTEQTDGLNVHVASKPMSANLFTSLIEQMLCNQ